MNEHINIAGKKNADFAIRESRFARVEGDRYWTEAWVTKAILSRVHFRGKVWEPACGRGDMAEVLVDSGYEVMISDIAGASLGCTNAAEADFLTQNSPGDATFSIVTNPPYTFAESFILKALELTELRSGMVAMLLRNEYDCAGGRRSLFERESFAAKFVLTKRPRWFESPGPRASNPRHNFAWYLWDHFHHGPARIEWLP